MGYAGSNPALRIERSENEEGESALRHSRQDSNVGALRGQQAESRDGAQPEVSDGEPRGEGETPALRIERSASHFLALKKLLSSVLVSLLYQVRTYFQNK